MVVGQDQDFDVISIDAKDFKSFTWKIQLRDQNQCPTCGPNGIVFQGDNVDLLCCEKEDEVFEAPNIAIKFRACGTCTDESKELPEFPVPVYPNFILGKNESTPFDFGLWAT